MKSGRFSIIVLLLFLSLPAATLKTRGVQDTAPAEAKYQLHEPDSNWVQQTLAGLSLRDKIAQLVQVRVAGSFINRESPQFLDLADAIRRNHIGGVTLFSGDVYESAMLLNELQNMSALPLIVAADFERGASFRISETTSFPWNMAVGATGSEELAFQQGAVTAREARALGVHWIYAPVVDVNNNPDNPVINIRSYGEDPQLVARLGAAFIRGARENGVLTTAKHFPGHGDTATDSHIGLAVVPANRSRLDAVEMVPFRSAVAAGVDAVMTAHVAVPQVTGESDVPATLSGKVLTDLLRGSLGFRGIVVTDALEMGGITNRYWTGLACIRAIQAGADMLLLPKDTDVAIQEVARAVERGDIPPARIDESVARVLALKTRLGLHKDRLAPIDRIGDVIASPGSQKLAQEMADRSITLLRDDAHLLPINPLKPPRLYSLVLSSEPDSNPAATFQTELRRRFPGVRTEAVDPRIPRDLADRIVRNATQADIIVCATVVRLISGKGAIALPDSQLILLRRISGLHKPVIWIAFGNPYLLHLNPRVASYLCAFGYSEGSYTAAAKALSGEIEISGRTPVTIPGYSKLGDGLHKPKLDMTLAAPAADAVGLDETKKLLTSYVTNGAFPGAALAVGYQGKLVLDFAAGRLDYDPGSALVDGNTLYDLASVSKVVGTTAAAMLLVDSGRLLLDAPVQDYLPEFQGANKEKVRVIQLLNHSSGMPAWSPIFKEVRDREEFMKRVYALALEFPPGSRTQYSDLGMLLLGEIVTRACGRPMDSYLAARLFGPLGMTSTLYRPPKEFLERIAPTENDPWRGRVLRGEVHDENAYALGGVAGHAGLFSTTRDLAVFAQMMLNRGIYDHRRYFRAEVADRFTTAQKSRSEALGWQKPIGTGWTGKVFSPAAYGHTGFTGTSIWIDPQKQLFIVLLTNRVHPSRENVKINEARQTIMESIIRGLRPR